MEKTFEWFGQRGVELGRPGPEREYAGIVRGIENVELVLLSAGEIPRELAAGHLHIGVTGTDLMGEAPEPWQARVRVLSGLGFGRADLVVAVPQCWVDVSTLDDLDAAAAAFRKAHGFRLRIATKYHRLVRDFLRHNGVAEYQLVDSRGATEGTVRQETAEAIADITSSGDTLRANHLKILEDGVILKSEATLFRGCRADMDEAVQQTMARLTRMIGVG